MNKSGAFRKKRVYFTQVSNIALRDNTLSAKAKGLYALIQSYINIPDFILYKTTLKKDCLEKERAFESMWKELKDKGYLIQYKLKNDNGCFYYEYELLDEPQKTENEKPIKKDNEIAQSELYSHSTHTLQNVGVDNVPSAKCGAYINTNLNNTDLNNTNTNKKKEEKETKSYKGYKAIIEEYSTNVELQQTIYSYIEMRKANRSVITDDALTILLTKLDTIAFSDVEKIEVLNKSILNCWKDIFPIQEKKITTKNLEVSIKKDNSPKSEKKLNFNNFDERGYSEEDYKFVEYLNSCPDAIGLIDREKLNLLKDEYDSFIANQSIPTNSEEEVKEEIIEEPKKKAEEEYVNPAYKDLLEVVS